MLRMARGLSAYAVAGAVLGSEDRYHQILKWEKGKHMPNPTNRAKLADFFLVSADYLTGL